MGKGAGKRLLEYGVAILAVAVAVFVRWLIDPWVGDDLPLATLFAAVAVAVGIGGYKPALLATVLGFLACLYLFIQPRRSFDSPSSRDLVGLLHLGREPDAADRSGGQQIVPRFGAGLSGRMAVRAGDLEGQVPAVGELRRGRSECDARGGRDQPL